MPSKLKSAPATGDLLHLPDAASQLGISVPTVKQWIYKEKIRSVQTPGGHHRIPQGEVDRLLFKARAKTAPQREREQHASVAAINWSDELYPCASAA